MRIFILTMNEPVFYGPIVSRILNSCPNEVVGIGTLPRPLNGWRGNFYYLRFWGLKAFIFILSKFIYKSIMKVDLPSFEAKRNHLIHYKLDNIYDVEKILIDNSIDVVIAFIPQIVPERILGLANKFWLNTHCGPLPQYAGIDAPFWSMLNGEKELAVTIHQMTSSIDRGSIFIQKFIPNVGVYFPQLFQLLSIAADEHIKLIKTHYENIEIIKPNVIGFYKKRPNLKDAKLFRLRGNRFI